MAATHRNSNIIANALATPKVISNPSDGAPGELKETAGLVTPGASDEAGSIHRFVRVPSNARISQVLLTCPVATSAGAVDIGVYETEENGGGVVDADLFASALALTSTAKANLDVTYESGEYTAAESVMPLWKVLGLAKDPHKEYDIAWTITTNFNQGPTSAVLKVRYVV
jgi:hypothetical protein